MIIGYIHRWEARNGSQRTERVSYPMNDPNDATIKERAAIKLARSYHEISPATIRAASDGGDLTPHELRVLGALAFVRARRLEWEV